MSCFVSSQSDRFLLNLSSQRASIISNRLEILLDAGRSILHITFLVG